jgi:hypothetical protein
MTRWLYVYNDPDAGPVAICTKCYDDGNSGYDIDEVDRESDEALDIDRICFFCGEYA